MLMRKFENENVKVTVEERRDGAFIATLWEKEMCLEVDRKVTEFETYGGAVDHAFTLVCAYMGAEGDESEEADHADD